MDIREITSADAHWPHNADTLWQLLSGRESVGRLWVAGDTSLLGDTVARVAVTGSAAATVCGEHIAADMGYGLAERDVATVSTLTPGVSSAALRGAMACRDYLDDAPSCRAIAILANGTDVDRTDDYAKLRRQIVAAGGLVVSPFPPSARVTARSLRLARLLAMSLASRTVIVETLRHGKLDRLARDVYGDVDLCAVPGPVTSAHSAGPHALIREGMARLVTCAADVLAGS